MGKSIRLFKIKGISIGLHPSWFVIFAFLTWSLATGYFTNQASNLPTVGLWVLGLVTSLLFFGSVLAHELGHSFVAIRNKVPVKSISLFFLGGLAEINREPDTPGVEFRIAIAGPMVSLALGLVFNGIAQLAGNLPFVATASSYLGEVNLLLGLFNLIPGFPMDGGRVLRAVIWKLGGDYYQSTRVASFTGQLVAYGFIAYGAISLFTGNMGNGIWMGLIGLFLLNMAGTAAAQARLQQKLDGIKVDQVMNRDYPSISGDTTLEHLVSATLSDNSRGTYLVIEDEEPAGVLSLRDITKIPRHMWSRIKAKEVMKPWKKSVEIKPDTPVLTALQEMEAEDLSLLPVVDGLQILGVLTRERVFNYLRLRTELRS